MNYGGVLSKCNTVYFFAGERIVVISHIITKEKEIPNEEIEKCIFHKSLFE